MAKVVPMNRQDVGFAVHNTVLQPAFYFALVV